MARTYGSTRKTPQEMAAVIAGDPADLAALLKVSEDTARALQQELARNFAQSDDLDRRVEEQTQQVLAQWLKTNRVDTIIGRLRFDGPNNYGDDLSKVKQVQDGKWVVVWPKEFATAPLQYPAPAWNQR